MKSLKFALALVSLLFCTTLILQSEASIKYSIKRIDDMGIPIKRSNDNVPIPIKRTKDIVVKKGTTTRIVQTKK